ncbi:NADH dehydrogenase [Ramaria rubella]|nr:NADH dehydrogenase [Ramaria rubella]
MSLLGGNTPRVRIVLTKSLNRRLLHDLTAFGSGYKPTLGYGPPGRSADTGHVATVFGCTGFLGRYLVHKLAKAGTKVIVPYREEDQKRHLKVMGDLGQVISLEWDIRNEDQTVECMRHSDIVYNLVGRDYETKNFTFGDVQVTGAARIARLASKLRIPRFVHVSHLNASRDSKSAYYRTKADGEEIVRQEFPDATIVRPASMFGHEDKLLNNMAFWAIWWKLNHSQTKIRPAHVLDVAQALHNLIDLPPRPHTYSLPGPKTYTYEELLELVSSVTFNPPSTAPILPKPVATLISRAAQLAWWPMISPDEVERRYIDDKSQADVPGDWDKLGVEPEEIELHALKYLRRYRSAENFNRPLILPTERRANAVPVCHPILL